MSESELSEAELGAPPPAASPFHRVPVWWMAPVWLVGRVRSGLREVALADWRWLQRAPIARVVLPALAVLVPLVVTALHATTPQGEQPPPELLAVVIRDVFTESLPFMAAALALGIVSPAVGALLVVVFGAGNLAVTVLSGELVPILGATFGRLVSYAVLWLLAVEIPMIGRWIAEWTRRSEDAPLARRLSCVAAGAGAIALTVAVWVQAAPMLITVVYWRTAGWGAVFLAAVQPLQVHGLILVWIGAGVGVAVLGLRYGGARSALSPRIQPRGASTPGRRLAGIAVSAAVSLALLSGLIHTPIDLAVLLVGLLFARPLGAAIASVSGLARLLAGVPLPVRLVLGIIVTVLLDKAYFSVFLGSDLSRFFHANVAIVLGFLVISVFAAPRPPRTGATNVVAPSTVARVFVFLAITLAGPTPVFADNCGDWVDCVGDSTRAAFAAAGAAALFAAKFLWDWARDVFGAPQPIGTLDKLASEEGAAAQDGAFSQFRNQTAQRAMAEGQDDRAAQIRSMSNGEFYQAAKNGDFSDLGVGPF
jgi:hypothetical protein